MAIYSITDFSTGTAKECVFLFNKALSASFDHTEAREYITDNCKIYYCGIQNPFSFSSFCDFIDTNESFRFSPDNTVTAELDEKETEKSSIVTGSICFCDSVDNLGRCYIEAICVKDGESWKIKRYSIEKDSKNIRNDIIFRESFPGNLIVFSADERYTIEYINNKMCRDLDFCCMGILKYQYGYSINNIVLLDDLPQFNTYVTAVINDEKPDDIQIRIKNKEYKSVWFAISGMKQTTDEGNSVVLLCYNIDKLKNNTTRTDTVIDSSVILENLPTMAHRFNMKERKLDYISDDFCSATGYSRENIEKQFDNKYLPMVHEEDRQTVINAFASLALVQQTITISYRLICKDGTILPVQDTIKSVHHNYDGRWEGYSALSIIKKEEKKEENTTFFEYNEYPRPVFLGRYDGNEMRCIYFNDSAKSLFMSGNVPESGTLCDLCSTNDDKNKMLSSLYQLYKGKKKASGITNIKINDSEQRYLYTMYVKKFEDDVMTFVVLLFDGDELQEIHDGITPEKRIRVRTFGYFDVFVDGKAVPFRNTKGKELLALLVDRRGGIVTSKDIVSTLWENEPVDTTTLSRARKVVMRLMEELREYGIEDMINSDSKGQKSINTEAIDCDLYKYLEDRKGNKELFNGSYMTNYSWGEYTLADLWPEI